MVVPGKISLKSRNISKIFYLWVVIIQPAESQSVPLAHDMVDLESKLITLVNWCSVPDILSCINWTIIIDVIVRCAWRWISSTVRVKEVSGSTSCWCLGDSLLSPPKIRRPCFLFLPGTLKTSKEKGLIPDYRASQCSSIHPSLVRRPVVSVRICTLERSTVSSMKYPAASVEFIGPWLHHGIDNSTRVPSILSWEIIGDEPELLYGFGWQSGNIIWCSALVVVVYSVNHKVVRRTPHAVNSIAWPASTRKSSWSVGHQGQEIPVALRIT